MALPTRAALRYQVDMLRHFPLLVWWGTFSCRYIAGTSTWSQHSWGNAVDLHPLNKSYGDRAHAYAQENAERLGIAHLLWQVPDHYDHIHADFYPQGIGVPPCAGGRLQWGDSSVTSNQRVTAGGRGGPALTPSGRNQPGSFNFANWVKCNTYCLGRKIPGAKYIPAFPGCADCEAAGLIGLPFNIGSYLKVVSGGIILLAGVAILLVAATGQQNRVAALATGGAKKATGASGGPNGGSVKVKSQGRSGTVKVPPRPDPEYAKRQAQREKVTMARRLSRARETGVQQAREASARRASKRYSTAEASERTEATEGMSQRARSRQGMRSTAKVRSSR